MPSILRQTEQAVVSLCFRTDECVAQSLPLINLYAYHDRFGANRLILWGISNTGSFPTVHFSAGRCEQFYTGSFGIQHSGAPSFA